MRLICPVCKSEEINFYMGGQFGKYECKDCGYVGVIVLEKIKRVKKGKMNHRIKVNKNKKLNAILMSVFVAVIIYIIFGAVTSVIKNPFFTRAVTTFATAFLLRTPKAIARSLSDGL